MNPTQRRAKPFVLSAAIVLLAAGIAHARTYVVDRNHPKASDDAGGTAEAPLRTISAAAAQAGPGDTVLVHAGIYRERVAPVRGGEPGNPVVYRAAPGEEVHIRGSELWPGVRWEAVADTEHVYRTALPEAVFRTGAPEGGMELYNPFATRLQSRENRSCGQVFVDGARLKEVDDAEEVPAAAGTWATDGKTVTIHLPRPYKRLDDCRVELTVRGRIFAPYKRGLGHIHVIGFRMSHCGNNFHQGFYMPGNKFPQAGALGIRAGRHWRIENCIIEQVKTTGIDCGYEGEYDAEGLGQRRPRELGRHVIRNCIIRDNGAAGIVGCHTPGTRIVGNVIERNDYLGLGGSETAGIKLHFLTDGLIAGNLIRDNDASGIWLDNTYHGSRVTRNVIVGNTGAALFLELGRGPLLVDNNVLAFSTAGRGLAGDGIYSHDAGGVTAVHNLIYFNANFGVWAHVGTDRRGGRTVASGWRVMNNLIVGNHRGAVSLPAESPRSRGNRSDYNAITGAYGLVMSETYGSPLDAPLFLVNTNKGRVPVDEVARRFAAALGEAGIPDAEAPDLDRWRERPVLSLEHWRLLSGNDRRSRVPIVLRPRGGREELEWTFIIDESVLGMDCPPIDGVTEDLFGRAIDPENVVPGPFQDLAVEPRLTEAGRRHGTRFRGRFEKLRGPKVNRYRLWPILREGEPPPKVVVVGEEATPPRRRRPKPRRTMPQDAPGSVENPVAVRPAPRALALDGRLADWRGVAPLPAPYEDEPSGSLRLAWQAGGLHGALAVKDARIGVRPDAPWAGDALELFLERDAAGAGAITPAAVQIILTPAADPSAGDGPRSCGVWCSREGDPAGARAEAVWRPTADGYVMEFHIPAEGLAPAKAEPRAMIGFHYSWNDDGRPVEQFFCDKDSGGFRTPARWGRIRLVGEGAD